LRRRWFVEADDEKRKTKIGVSDDLLKGGEEW